MPTVTIPIDITWTGASGSPGVNVWHGRIDSAVEPFEDLGTLTEFLETFYSGLLSLFTTTTTIRWAGEANGVGDDTGDLFTSDPWTLTGTGSNGAMPPANCMLASWRAATGGRSGRGRTFLGPLDRGAEENNGTPAELFRTAVQGEIDELISSSSGFGNGALGIYSRADGVFRDFVSGTCPNYFAVLRSRRD